MPGRILYHLDFDKNQKTLAIDESQKDSYIASGDWFMLPEDAFAAAKNLVEEKLDLAKKAAEKAESVIEEAIVGEKESKTRKGKPVQAGEVKNPTKDFEFHVKF